MLSMALKLAAIAICIYLVILVGAVLVQRRLTYYPSTQRVPPAAAGLDGVSERVIETPDGHRLVAWYRAARPGQPTILYFHGNAGGLATRSERMRKYLERGRGMLMMAYRGYAGSSGSPSERANVADALLAYELLIKDGVRPEDLLIYGESLGSGVATQVAANRPCAGLVLDAPYTSLVDVGADAYPFLPVRLLMTDRYDTLAHMPKVTAPLLVIHGEQDGIIPVAMGRKVHAAHRGPSQIVTFPRAGHSDHHLYGSFEAINAWIDALRAGEQRQRRAAP